jgi:exodeoxyribonuclease-3
VNGLRAAEKKGFGDWLGQTGADIVAVQETKARPEQLCEALLNPPGYRAHWRAAEKKGYSGSARTPGFNPWPLPPDLTTRASTPKGEC